MATFEVKGPFEVPLTKEKAGRRIANEHGKEFWKAHKSIENDVGCYVFAFRAAKGLKPMYVGKATKSFKQEIFTLHKLGKYNEALTKQAKGTPVMFFVSFKKSRGMINKTAIDDAESFLIQAGITANKNLLNDRKVAVEKWGIKGVIRGGKGAPPEPAKVFKQCMGL